MKQRTQKVIDKDCPKCKSPELKIESVTTKYNHIICLKCGFHWYSIESDESISKTAL